MFIGDVDYAELDALRALAQTQGGLGLNPSDLDKLLHEVVVHLGSYRMGKQKFQSPPLWRRKGRRNAEHLANVIRDCGKAWTAVTNNDWKKVAGWNTGGILPEDSHPPVMLARIIIEHVEGKPRTHSLAKQFRKAKEIDELN